MVRHSPVSAEVVYYLIEKIDNLIQQHNQIEPEAFMPKVVAEEYYRGTPEWSLALEWRTRQGVASFNLHANRGRACMTFIFLREPVTAKTWADILNHPGKPHWNRVIDYIATLGDYTLWNHEIHQLQKELEQRKATTKPA